MAEWMAALPAGWHLDSRLCAGKLPAICRFRFALRRLCALRGLVVNYKAAKGTKFFFLKQESKRLNGWQASQPAGRLAFSQPLWAGKLPAICRF
jgi:hypothetical protein